MKVLSMGFPKTMFPFRSVSQRLNLEYDEIDEIMDKLFEDIFADVDEKTIPEEDSAETAA